MRIESSRSSDSPPNHLPRSTSFLRVIDSSGQSRLGRLGWSLEKTVLLESEFVPILGGGLAGVSSAGPVNPKRGFYYHVLLWGAGVLRALSNDEIEILIAHETDEMRELDLDLRSGQAIRPRTSEKTRDEHLDRLIPDLYSRFGKDPVDRALERVSSLATSLLVTPGLVLSAWLRVYVDEHTADLRPYEIAMTKDMLRLEQTEAHISSIMQAIDFYDSSEIPEALLQYIRDQSDEVAES